MSTTSTTTTTNILLLLLLLTAYAHSAVIAYPQMNFKRLYHPENYFSHSTSSNFHVVFCRVSFSDSLSPFGSSMQKSLGVRNSGDNEVISADYLTLYIEPSSY